MKSDKLQKNTSNVKIKELKAKSMLHLLLEFTKLSLNQLEILI